MNVLCVTAHPDDESVFAGGTLALLARRGAEVRIACCTRGEGGETGEPPVCGRAELGAVRSEELRCAARALGCAGVDFLPFRDPDIGPENALYAFAASAEEVAAALTDILASRKPDVLITHGSGGEYGHPGHLLTHRAALQAARAANVATVYTFGADFPGHPRRRSANRDDPADLVLDITPAFEQKLAALECHRTQGALFVRRPSAEAGRPVPLREAVLRVESLRRRTCAPGGRDIVALLDEYRKIDG
jgi:LmbE family N-acetylglucosaminyl deacetylase